MAAHQLSTLTLTLVTVVATTSMAADSGHVEGGHRERGTAWGARVQTQGGAVVVGNPLDRVDEFLGIRCVHSDDTHSDSLTYSHKHSHFSLSCSD